MKDRRLNAFKYFKDFIFNFVKSTGSLQKKLFVFFFVLMVFMAALISVSSYFVFKNLIVKEIGKSRVDVLKLIGERTRVIKNSALTISSLYYYDENIYKAISNKKDKNVLDQSLVDSLSNIASRYQLAFEKNNISFYSIIDAKNGFEFNSINSELSYNYSKIQKTLWYNKIIKQDGEIFWVTSYDDSDDPSNSKYVFSAARIFKEKNTGENLGVLLINIEERSLFNTYKNVLEANNYIYIIDEKGSIVSHRDENMLGNNFFDMETFNEIFNQKDFKIIKKGNESILFSKYFDSETNWTIVEEIPLNELLKPLISVRYTILGIFIVCTLLSMVFSLSFSQKTAYPLRKFCQSMEKIRNGNLDVISNIKGWDEIKLLSDGFNQMVDKIKILLNNIKEKEKLKRKAELDFLQAQINPHFLYNTLFSIKCMIAMNKNTSAEEMLTAFLDLLQKTFNNKEEFIYIADEIDCLKKYIIIQQHRYSDKFKVEFEFQGDILNSMIPKLILQPLVENSIFHGIEPKKGNGIIIVTGEMKDQDIIIKIMDDGVGINDTTLKGIWKNNLDDKDRRFNGVGVLNVHNRIQLNFGIQYGIKIFSEIGKGTEIYIKIPIVKD